MEEWAERIKAAMTDCTLCPRNCHADRAAGKTGYCGQTAQMKAGRAALHFWEEPCISGVEGSGAVFFTGCSLRCSYCQNAQLAAGLEGVAVSEERLAEIFLELQEKRANNINLVTPTHFIPQIAAALDLARRQGLAVPVVYNSGGYEKPESLRLLDGLVDIYLPDFKYLSPKLAQEYSGAADYAYWAKQALAEMVRQVGEPVFRTKEGKTLTAREWNAWMDEEPDGPCQLNQPDGSGKPNQPGGPCQLNQPDGSGKPNQPEGPCPPDWPGGTAADDYHTMPLLQKGVIVRHLVLPGSVWDSKAVLKYLYRTYGNRIYISIMNQYTPMRQVKEHPLLRREVMEEEYEEAVDFALELGVENGFFQESGTAKESFIPAFDGEGIV